MRVLDQLQERFRLMHYSLRTEETYVYWVKAFLTHFADDRSVAPSTHSQALSPLLFFYTKVLRHDLPWLQEISHPRRHRRLRVVLSAEEVRGVLAALQGEHPLLARLLYGTGLRITEAWQLRVKDLDFAQRSLTVREGKGAKNRVVMLPRSGRW